MDNYDICSRLALYAKLAELHDENAFRTRAFSAAAFNLKKVKEPMSQMSDEALAALPGVGKGVLSAIRSLVADGTFPDLDALIAKTPPGILEMLRIKGLGPKKVGVIWHQMAIDTVADLFNACRENRLVELPGFGLKTQGEVMHAIQFMLNASGRFHYARAEEPAQKMLQLLKNRFATDNTELTGDIRRFCETLESIDIITTAQRTDAIAFMAECGLQPDGDALFRDAAGFLFQIHFAETENFSRRWIETTGNDAHLQEIGFANIPPLSGTEEDAYSSLGMPFILPELREGRGESRKEQTATLIEYSHLKGVLHNHTLYSDGLHSLKDMAEHAVNIGLQYLGICDHSRSASYAGGLQVEQVLTQFAEIDALNAQWTNFRIFKGIESDILSDGSLDYPDEVLSQFDFIVASVHSNLKMAEDRAMQRLIRAIENKYTTILGHPTGRLLLVREGYPVNHRYLIDACAANGVCMELNANPYRLDLDWRWIDYAMEKGVMIAINPDAHEKEGYYDMYYGSLVARKGGLTREMTLNAMNLHEFTNWLGAHKTQRNA
jgi:DNA polymerase (family 10)